MGTRSKLSVSALPFAFVTGLLAGTLPCPNFGTVRSAQKISDTEGGLAGALDNSDLFGVAVASLGDLDGDGVPDLAVGARRDDDGGFDRGAAWVLLLNADGTVKGEQKISGTAGGFAGALDNVDQFGIAVAGLGDLDGDGVRDLAVGCYLDDDGGTDRGAVYVLFLNANGTVRATQKVSDTAGGFTGVLDDGDLFGSSLAAIGDLDADGVSELAVGAFFDDDGGGDRGAVWVLFMNADGTVRAHQKISSSAGGFAGALDDNDQFGISLAALGDRDGDGVLDLGVGAYLDDDGGPDRGAAWLLYLNSDGTVKGQAKLSSISGGIAGVLDDNDQFGISVSGLADLDGDGIREIAVGAARDDDGGTDRGAAWLFFMNADGTVKTERKFSDLSGDFNGTLDDNDQFGSALAPLGDPDGDGVADLAIGALRDDDGGTDRGAVWMLTLRECPPVIASQPVSVILPAGGGAAMFTLSTERPALTYQWRRDGVVLVDGDAIAGAETATLSIAATFEDIGAYDCVVADANGETTSEDAVLAVRQCKDDADGNGVRNFADITAVLRSYGLLCE